MDDLGERSPGPGPVPVPPHAGLRYGLLRIGMLLVVGLVLYLVGMRSWPWLFATVLVSAVLSFFVLLRQREAAARSLEASVAARSARKRGAEPPFESIGPDMAGDSSTADPTPAASADQASAAGDRAQPSEVDDKG